MKSLFVSDIRENQQIDSTFLVTAKNHGVTKGGSGYLTLKLADRSGEIEGRAAELITILRSMNNPPLRSLAEAFFADEAFMDLFKRAPAAKTIHHPYLGGLLEHTLSLLKLILTVVENYQGIDVDLLLMGGFLHDLGKIYEFSFDRAVEYTDRGQLLGHLVMEVEIVHEKIKTIPDFPEELALLVNHMIVGHHGS